jgi:hypothetical protein
MYFQFTRLNEHLFYICWYDTPPLGDSAELQFLEEAKKIVNEATTPQYFISDLRKGRLTNVEILRKLGSVAKNPMWGGGTGFTLDPLSRIFAGIYVRFAKNAQERDAMFDRPEDALAFLESLKQGITANIDWPKVLGMDIKLPDAPSPTEPAPTAAAPESDSAEAPNPSA